MADLPTNLQTLQDNAADIALTVDGIATAIAGKGGTLPANPGLMDFPGAINSIPLSSVTDVQVDTGSILDGNGVADLVTTGDYEDDDTSENYNPLATKHYVDDTVNNIPKPMIFKSGATLTADSSDTTKCSIAVVKPDISHGEIIKDGYTYKVTSIAVSPTYTGTIKVGDVLIAAKDSPKLTADWVVDTDWTVVPSGDDPEYDTTYGLSGTTYDANNTKQIVTLTDSNSNTTTADIVAMTGATGSVAGKAGLVPKPAATDNTKFLTGGGIYANAITEVGSVAAGGSIPSGGTEIDYYSVSGETLILKKLYTKNTPTT